MFAQWTIGKKLGLSLGFLVILTLAVGFVAWRAVSSLGDQLDTAINRTTAKILLADHISQLTDQISADNRGMMLGYMNKDAKFVQSNMADMADKRRTIDNEIQQIRPLLLTAEGKAATEELEQSWGMYDPLLRQYQELGEKGNFAEAQALLTDGLAPARARIDANSDKLIKVERDLLAQSQKDAAATSSSSRWSLIVAICISLATGILVVFVLRMINSSLRKAISDLSEGAGQVASAAGQISSSSQSLAQGTSEQAAALEETSASSEEINSMARKNTENSQSADALVAQSQQKFAETNHSLEAMVVAMSDIKTSSDKVSKIIKVIDEIAFQTNILALNAAVEAARAGEAGMGFAVVADEVRNLAQRCAQAAKDTAALIEESIAKSNDGKTKVDQVAVAIRSITEDSAKVKTLVDEVSLGSQEQTRGIEQVAKALTQMEQVTQQAAANAEESAAAAEELNAQASTLTAVVCQLNALVGGAEDVQRSQAARPSWHASSAPASSPGAAASAPKVHIVKPATPKAGDPFPLEPDFKAMV